MSENFIGDMLKADESEPEAEPVAEQETQVEAQPEPERLAEQEVSDPTPEPVEQGNANDVRTVPLGTFLDQRDKLSERAKAAEAERDRLQRELQQRDAGDSQGPDLFDDPEGFVQQRLYQQKLEFSYMMAVQANGKEEVEGARKWAIEKAQSDPAFNEVLRVELQNQMNPLDWIVQQHKRDALLSDIGDNPDDWFAREAAKRGYVAQSATEPVTQPVATQTQAKSPAMPPRSIASDAAMPSDQTPKDDRSGFLATMLG